MEKPEKINLGKKTFWWKIRIVLFAPLWLMHPNRKDWEAFKHGLINHKCKFDFSKPKVIQGVTFFSCRHFGCNTVDPHEHKWEVQYRTGDAFTGKSDVCRCECGQWAVYHRNPACGKVHTYHLIK